jgi:2-keto-4-pentenoate hydratase/2-oxohepta-3-ene-1,7-dioic acid hydratase in catechol pathway
MRLHSYLDRFGDPRWGVLVDGRLLTGAQLEKRGRLRLTTHLGLVDHIRSDDDWERRVRRATKRALAAGAPLIDPADREPRPAIEPEDAGKIICIGLNYRDHCAEQGIDPPTRPTLFAKFANAIVGDGEPVVRPAGTQALDFEVELGVVIGQPASHVPATRAMEHVAGYGVCNDVTARDWQGNKAALAEGQRGDGQWLRAKGSDTFLPIGPVLATPEDLPDPHGLRLGSWRIPGSGAEAGREIPMQAGTTADMVFRIPEIIEFVSAVIALDPGDLVITGTPAGVGVFRDPPVFLEPGDRVVVEVEGIGRVGNPIVELLA